LTGNSWIASKDRNRKLAAGNHQKAVNSDSTGSAQLGRTQKRHAVELTRQDDLTIKTVAKERRSPA